MRVGQQIKKRYKVIRLLGSGGMGSVAEVVDSQTGIHMAAKEIDAAVIAAGGVGSFIKEAATLDTLHHQNLVQYRGFESEGKSYYIFTSLVQGNSLEHSLVAGSLFPEKLAIEIMIQVLEGLAYAHSKGVIHRDIKPANIMWDGKTPTVVDFGISRSGGSVGGATMALFAGAFTRHFGAPEQQGSSPPDPRNDIYTVGVTLYDIVTGNSKVFPEMPADRYMSDPVFSLPGVSAGLESVLMKATAVSMNNRYNSADEFANELRALVKGGGTMSGGGFTPNPAPPRPPKTTWTDIRRTK